MVLIKDSSPYCPCFVMDFVKKNGKTDHQMKVWAIVMPLDRKIVTKKII